MLAEIYYEVDEFNKLYLEKIAGYASNINRYPKRKIGCLSMSEIMTILTIILIMDIKTWIDKTNNLIPSVEKYIIGFQKITEIQMSYDEAIDDIENLKLEYIENKKANNIIEELIFNTTIHNKGCFLILYFKNEFATDGLTTLNHLKEFGSFLECDIIYFNTENGEIWIQKPGTYYYYEPDSVEKGFSSGESFLESIYLIQKAFYEKWYEANPIPENLFRQLYEINDDDCIEGLDYFFENLVNFE